jgi:hypothetical protein
MGWKEEWEIIFRARVLEGSEGQNEDPGMDFHIDVDADG